VVDNTAVGASAPISSVRSNDMVLSRDGALLYATDPDGFVRVYDTATGALVNAFKVGTNLGAMSLAPDGTFLMVCEVDVVVDEATGVPFATSYRVDLATGEAVKYQIANVGMTDVAVMADGNAIFSLNASVRWLDLSTGEFSRVSTYGAGAFSASEDGTQVVLGDKNRGNAPLSLYEVGIGHTGSDEWDNVMGYNHGVQAFSQGGDLVAQHLLDTPGDDDPVGLNIYNSSLEHQFDLSDVHRRWAGANVAGLAFDLTGANLYVLDSQTNSIVQVSTGDWRIVRSFDVGADVAQATHADSIVINRLLVGPDAGYFMVATEDGIRRIDNPFVLAAVVGTAGDDAMAGRAVDDSLAGGLGNDTLRGAGGADLLKGEGGDDVMFGGDGIDAMLGGAGNDTYNVDHSNEKAVEFAGGGIDTVSSSASFRLGYQVENLILTGTAAINGTGGHLANMITGNRGANRLIGAGGDDQLDGGAGADKMVGGVGDDLYVVDDAGDEVAERPDEGRDLARSSVSYAMDAGLEALILVGNQAVDAVGNSSVNEITGNDAANTLRGGGGADLLIGKGGDDTYVLEGADTIVEEAAGGRDTVVATGTYTLGAQFEELVLAGNMSDDVELIGNAAANVIRGNVYGDSIDGKGGADLLVGGGGDDVYYIDVAADRVEEGADAGVDTINTRVSHVLEANVEHLVIVGDRAANGTGNELANEIIGNSAANYLDGGAGADVLTGGQGDDTYVFNSFADTLVEAAGGGTDTVLSSIGYWLRADFETLTLTGIYSIEGTGNDVANRITGNDAHNVLDGRGGADTLIGNLGDDVYKLDNAGDRAVERADGGYDTVQSSFSSVLSANFESLALLGTGNLSATGNSAANLIVGNSGNNLIDGRLGADEMRGMTGNDSYRLDNVGDRIIEFYGEGLDSVEVGFTYTLIANVERLTLVGTRRIDGFGNSVSNDLTGNEAANVLDGKGGADMLAGGAGDDTYVVDNVDRISEALNGGYDRVLTTVHHVLAANVEMLTLIGSAAIRGTGNLLDNLIIGNGGANILTGGGGTDTLKGGRGNDAYVVADLNDGVVELAGEGTDTVTSGVSYTLGANVENLKLSGAGGKDATGNALANVITGNSGADRLDGGAGADRLNGGAGDDHYFVDNSADAVVELAAKGHDSLYSTVTRTLSANVEDLLLTGTALINGTGNNLGNLIVGNDRANRLDGGAGNDIVSGRGGGDTLTGGSGGDQFNFDSALAGDVDTITDFSTAYDVIALDGEIFAGIAQAGPLGAGAFRAGTAAADAGDRIIYDSASGRIFYDADGNGSGAAILFAKVDVGTGLTHADFLVI
jgi:Ca2+-binding RTX toxin-like protein